MSHTRQWIALGLVLAAPVLLAQRLRAQSLPAQTAAPTPTTPHHQAHKSRKAQTPVALPPLPSGPLSQLPMDQIPATKANVSFEGGLLTISAQNSTLGEILRDVRRLTGASIEIPPGNAASERVVTHLGPGAPRDVMAGLLNGSSFDYVMLGSSSDPTAVSSVVLIAKPSSTGESQTAANGNQGNPGTMSLNGGRPQPFTRQALPMPGQPGNGQPANAEEDSKDDDSDSPDDNSDDQAQQGQPAPPDTAAGNTQDQQQPDPSLPNAGPKSPEQILEMLQKQRQLQTGPAAPNQQPPPQ